MNVFVLFFFFLQMFVSLPTQDLWLTTFNFGDLCVEKEARREDLPIGHSMRQSTLNYGNYSDILCVRGGKQNGGGRTNETEKREIQI